MLGRSVLAGSTQLTCSPKVEEQVQGARGQRGETAAGFGSGERQAEAAVGGRDARQRRVEGTCLEKW